MFVVQSHLGIDPPFDEIWSKFRAMELIGSQLIGILRYERPSFRKIKHESTIHIYSLNFLNIFTIFHKENSFFELIS